MTSPFIRFAIALSLLSALGCGSSKKVNHTRDGGSDGSVEADAGNDAAPSCVPTADTELSCNGVDDDCDGVVDNVDVGEDGINDCLRIGILGIPGAFGSSNFAAWLDSKGTTVERLQGDDIATITLAQLQNYDVVIVDQLLKGYTEEDANALKAFVSAGGGVMFMTGYGASAGDYEYPNTLLAPFGLAYDAGLDSGPVTMFSETHPIVAGLTSVTFSGGHHVIELEGSFDGTNTTVADLTLGPAGVVQELGQGRLFVWGDEWIEFDSEWTSMPEITTFWTNILGWLAPVE